MNPKLIAIAKRLAIGPVLCLAVARLLACGGGYTVDSSPTDASAADVVNVTNDATSIEASPFDAGVDASSASDASDASEASDAAELPCVAGETRVQKRFAGRVQSLAEYSRPGGGSFGYFGASWLDPHLAKVVDGQRATATIVPDGGGCDAFHCPSAITNALLADRFGFTIPADATILQVEPEITRLASVANTVSTYHLYLLNGGAIGPPRPVVDSIWPTTEANERYVLDASSWSPSPWYGEMMNDGGTGFYVVVGVPNDGGTATALVDAMSLTITYLCP